MNAIADIDPRSSIIVSQELREALLEFTLCCLLEQPVDLIPYARDYFTELDTRHTPYEYDEYCPPDSDSDEDDYEALLRKHSSRQSEAHFAPRARGRVIYAEGYNPEKDTDDDANIQTYEKTPEQRDMLTNVSKQCLLFRALDDESLKRVIDVMFPVEVQKGDYVIKQYDDGDNFYVIEYGIYDAFIADEPDAEPKHIFSYENSGSFGELALMYNMPRAATVQAATKGRLWAMDRNTFRKVVLKGAFKKRKMYETLISEVDMLKELTPYEKMSLADALMPKVFNEGDVIMAEGDAADGMYFVENGRVEVSMIDEIHGERVKICEIKEGGYFGELALVKDQPRAATVQALGPQTKLAFLDKAAFERILGPCMDIMMRNMDTYGQQVKHIMDAVV